MDSSICIVSGADVKEENIQKTATSLLFDPVTTKTYRDVAGGIIVISSVFLKFVHYDNTVSFKIRSNDKYEILSDVLVNGKKRKLNPLLSPDGSSILIVDLADFQNEEGFAEFPEFTFIFQYKLRNEVTIKTTTTTIKTFSNHKNIIYYANADDWVQIYPYFIGSNIKTYKDVQEMYEVD